jgi:hypothetical protein
VAAELIADVEAVRGRVEEQDFQCLRISFDANGMSTKPVPWGPATRLLHASEPIEYARTGPSVHPQDLPGAVRNLRSARDPGAARRGRARSRCWRSVPGAHAALVMDTEGREGRLPPFRYLARASGVPANGVRPF